MLDIISFLTGGANRIKLKRHEYIRAGLMMIGIMAIIVLFALEIKYFSNTFQVRSLVFKSLLIGAIVGAIASYYLTKDKPEVELLTKFQYWVGLIVLTMIFSPLFGSLSNRLLNYNNSDEINVEFVKSEGFYSSRFGLVEGQEVEAEKYFTFLIVENDLFRLKTKTNPYPKAKKGDKVRLPIKHGFWGYDYATLK